jgi:hypothetical protein
MGEIAFSPEQKRLRGAILILKQIKLWFLLKGQRNRPRNKRITHLIRKYKYKGTKTFTTIEQINSTLKQSITKYNAFKLCAKEQRWSHLETIAWELDQITG